MRWRRSFVFGLGWLISGVLLAGCDFEQLAKDIADGARKGSSPTASIPGGSSNLGKTPTTIAVGTFNIQVFGQSKLENAKVMNILAQIARRFDVLAIQELRSKEQDVIPRFLELVNADGRRFDYIIGPRLGRTSSKEQYVYIYDADRLEVLPGSVYTADDPDDLLHREPLVATFRVRGARNPDPFTFTLINIHTDPDETDWELDALAEVFVAVQRDRIREDDVILLGDLNVDEYHLGELGRLPGMAWVISGQPTNTRGTATYDNILFDRRNTVEFTGRAGVLSLQEEFGLSLEEALEVSDHLPVWAVFHATENTQTGGLATRPRETR